MYYPDEKKNRDICDVFAEPGVQMLINNLSNSNVHTLDFADVNLIALLMKV